MTGILYRYLIVIIACIALLIGLQVPNFIDQYQKRIDAHLREVTANLKPFQEIADHYFGGDLMKLIEMNLKADAAPLQEEGKAIEQMVQRKLRFESDMAALQTSLVMKAVHVMFHGDQEIIDEALNQYSYAVPLDEDALAFGAGAAVAILVSAELLFALLRFAFSKLYIRFRQPARQ